MRPNRTAYEPRHRKAGPARVGGGEGGGRRARDLRAVAEAREPVEGPDVVEERSA
jgi:hypothetical protein